MDPLHEKVAEVFRTLGDRSRFAVLLCLLSGPCNVSEVVRSLRMKQSLVSHHLRVLKESGLVQAERKGPFVLYSIAKPEVHGLIALGAKIVTSTEPKSKQGYRSPRKMKTE